MPYKVRRRLKSQVAGGPHLDEADVLGVLTEALAADVQAILADQTVVVAAHAAAGRSVGRRVVALA